MPAENISVLLQQAIQQVKNGQKQAAAHNLALVLRADPDQADAWLWLSACVDTREKQIYCLRQVLRIDPNHLGAQKGLEELTGAAATQPVPVTGAPAPPAPRLRRTQGAMAFGEGGDALPSPERTGPGGEVAGAMSFPVRQRDTSLPSPERAGAGGVADSGVPFPITEGEEPIYEAHAEAPVEAARRPGWIAWLVLGLMLFAAFALNWVVQRNRAGGDGRPFVLPAGRFASAETRIQPGDDLAKALRDAPEGGVVTLQAGTYTLDRTLIIDRALQVRGAGMNTTRIHSTAAEAALLVRAAGGVQLSDLEILHAGDTPADGVVAENGQLRASGVRVGGARLDEKTGEGGRGLLVRHGAGAEVSNSEMVDNDRAGIEIRSPAGVSLRQNAVHDNGQYGVAAGSDANVRLQENEINQNGDAGVLLQDNARGELRGNVLEQNAGSGVLIEGQSAPTLYANTSQGNARFGIEIRGQAAPILINNIAKRNGKAGIAYFDRTAGAAESNDCSENELHGISVNQNASPFLKENRCNQNRQVGIDYWGDSGGTAANNQCSENGLQGIAVHENAQPVLQNNACAKNSDSGIIYWDNAGGTASNNECSENAINGISVHDQARPQLMNNTCQQNKKYGIIFYERSGGTARENECKKNGNDDIIRPDGADVVLQGNRCGSSLEQVP